MERIVKKIYNFLMNKSIITIEEINGRKSIIWFFIIPVFVSYKIGRNLCYNLWFIDQCFSLSKQDDSISIRIFGFTIRYVKGWKYNDLINSLKILQNFTDIDQKLIHLIQKHKKNKIFRTWSLYEQDFEKVKNYISSKDPSQLSIAQGKLRQYQLELLTFTTEVARIMENLGCHPTLAGGNLLGAVRHGGYIPWDDDIDFDLIRNEYTKVVEWSKKNCIYVDTTSCRVWGDYLECVDLALQQSNGGIVFAETPSGGKFFRGSGLETCYVIDIFPWDCISPFISERRFEAYWRNMRYSLLSKKENWGEIFNCIQKELDQSGIFVEDSDKIYYGLGNHGFYAFNFEKFRYKAELFPCQRMAFEGVEFYAPRDTHIWLRKQYGENYLKLPVKIKIAEHAEIMNKHYLERVGKKYFLDLSDMLL